MILDTPIGLLNKVGKITANKLKRLGINKVKDLLFYYPFRYEDYSRIIAVKDLREGEVATIKAKVELVANRRTRFRKIITEGLVSDESGSLRVVWFNQPFLTKYLLPGKIFYFSGTVKRDMLGLQFVSPAYEAEGKETIHTARLIPVYPSTEGVTQKQLRFLVQQSLPAIKDLQDFLPGAIKSEYGLPDLQQAVKNIHFPEGQEELKKAEGRLKFDELLLVQLQAELARLETSVSKAPVLAFKEEEIKKFVVSLPFALTKTQKISAWEILQNVGENKPMNRLLSGDVGSGKTVVAALALLNCAMNGFQGVLMAPTEILASQHFNSLIRLLPDLRISLFTRSQKLIFAEGKIEEVKKPALSKNISEGKSEIIIGTHALLSEGVNFRNIGMVIVDEQHRFGVVQRKIIKEKGKGVHFLSMTATPIPRSLALMLYGDLDVSIINELPPGRKPVKTRLVQPHERERAYRFIWEEIKKGRQAFVVCPLIEESNSSVVEKKSVLNEYKKLSELIFPDLRVSYLHGKMKGEEKESLMNRFKKREIDILIATSVIEVGVDVPNATVMMIEGADRFGLAQLHQFRGRVGRGQEQSYCLLFTDNESERTLERLKYFETHNDGFSLAEKDLELRGPGEVYGTTQSGMMQLRLAKLTDRELIKTARDAAKKIAPELSEHKLLKEKMKEWEKTLHLE